MLDSVLHLFEHSQGDKTAAAQWLAKENISIDLKRLSNADWQVLYDAYSREHGDRGHEVRSFDDFQHSVKQNIAEVVRLSKYYR